MRSSETTVCGLCGTEYDPTDSACHTSCPLSKGCNLSCCPACGYQTPDENRSVAVITLKRLMRSLQPHQEASPS